MPDLPQDVSERLRRGRKQMRKDASKRRLCLRFERGDTYWYIDGKGLLNFQSTTTATNGTGKPPHRIRNKYNFIRPIVDAKVSAATQRVPSYEVVPTSTDFQTISAVGIAKQVALYGYDEWRLRTVTEKAVRLAIGGGGVSYTMPYFDENVGPYRKVGDQWVGQGEVKLLVLSGNEAYGEAGVDFEESRWYAIERARPIEDVKELPGFIKGSEIAPDASTSDIPTDRDRSENLAMVTEYFERPSPKYPKGRCMVIHQDRMITDYRLNNPDWPYQWGPYPLMDSDGSVLDEPILHRLVYTVDPENDNDFGLTWQLIDFQRTAQDCINKMLEYKNRGLNPQMKAPVGSIVTPPDDVPGAIRYYRVVAGREPEWERPLGIPQELFQLLERVLSDMRDVSADFDFNVAPNVAAQTVQAGQQQAFSRWESFLGDLAEWHSRLMRHCLVLVGRYYNESRTLDLRGRDGWQLLQGFKGAKLMGQTRIRVLPQSLAPITRQGIRDQLSWLNQNFPGFLSPEAALTALDSGSIDRLTESYWLDVGQANMIVQKIRDGSVMSMPTRTQKVLGVNGQPVAQEVPSYMPSDQSNLTIWKQVFGDWMKTDEYLRLTPDRQDIAKQIWSGIEVLEQQRAQRQAALQTQMAQQLGMANAARPQNGKPMPSLPGSGQTPAAN